MWRILFIWIWIYVYIWKERKKERKNSFTLHAGCWHQRLPDRTQIRWVLNTPFLARCHCNHNGGGLILMVMHTSPLPRHANQIAKALPRLPHQPPAPRLKYLQSGLQPMYVVNWGTHFLYFLVVLWSLFVLVHVCVFPFSSLFLYLLFIIIITIIIILYNYCSSFYAQFVLWYLFYCLALYLYFSVSIFVGDGWLGVMHFIFSHLNALLAGRSTASVLDQDAQLSMQLCKVYCWMGATIGRYSKHYPTGI